jgi:hypothetical protein
VRKIHKEGQKISFRARAGKANNPHITQEVPMSGPHCCAATPLDDDVARSAANWILAALVAVVLGAAALAVASAESPAENGRSLVLRNVSAL